jgi:hypothetical protein
MGAYVRRMWKKLAMLYLKIIPALAWTGYP